MADNQKNTQAPVGGELKGGTEATGAGGRLANVGGPSGGTNSLSAAGASQPDAGPAAPPGGPAPRSGGTRTDSRDEPEELFEGSRKPSHATAKQRARDAADVDTTHGLPAAPGNPRQQEETDPFGTGQSTPSESQGVEVTEASKGTKGVGERK